MGSDQRPLDVTWDDISEYVKTKKKHSRRKIYIIGITILLFCFMIYFLQKSTQINTAVDLKKSYTKLPSRHEPTLCERLSATAHEHSVHADASLKKFCQMHY